MEYDFNCLHRKFASTINTVRRSDGVLFTGFVGDLDDYERHAAFSLAVYTKGSRKDIRFVVPTEKSPMGIAPPEGYFKGEFIYQHFPSGWYWESTEKSWKLLTRHIKKSFKVGISNDSHTVLCGSTLSKAVKPLNYAWDFTRKPTREEGFFSSTLREFEGGLFHLDQKIGCIEGDTMLLDFPSMERFVNKEKQWKIV